MVLMVPVALYLEAIHNGFQPGMAVRRVPPFELGLLAGVLGVVALAGVGIAVRRRATFREAIVQWCVPPTCLLVLSTLSFVVRDPVIIFLVFLGILLSTSAALARLASSRDNEDARWPKNWIVGSIAWGFAYMGIMIFLSFAFLCCLGPFALWFTEARH
jgi:hypothetical protein